MNDSYYGKEEEVETPETQLDNYRAQLGASDAVVVWAQETLTNVYDKTFELWNKAAETNDVEMQNGLTEIYKGAEHMQQNLIYTNAAMKSVLAAADALAQQKKQAESDLDDLVDAIDTGDYDHPVIATLVENVEQNAYVYASEGLYEDAYEGAEASIYEEFFTALRTIAPGVSYLTMNAFISGIKGDAPINDIQRGLLLSLLQTFTVESKAS